MSGIQAWDSDKGKKEMFPLLSLETHSPQPLTALEQLHGGTGIWKESPLTAVGMNQVITERLPLAPKSKCTSISGPTQKQSVDNAKGITVH